MFLHLGKAGVLSRAFSNPTNTGTATPTPSRRPQPQPTSFKLLAQSCQGSTPWLACCPPSFDSACINAAYCDPRARQSPGISSVCTICLPQSVYDADQQQ